jgi:L-fucose isomerase-like protein
LFKGSDYSDYGSHTLNLIFVRTGGTEGIFKGLFPELLEKSDRPFYLLTSGKSNSLAASMEILSYLRQNHFSGEIIHGSPEYITSRILLLEKVEGARKKMDGCRLGVIGKPSDWLISSYADYGIVKQRLGVELVDVPMNNLLDTIAAIPEKMPSESSDREMIRKSLPGANRIYMALRDIIDKQQLQGLTLRCFDLLNTVKNTGCLALAKLNSEGFVAGCEGDVPAMLSMKIIQSITGLSGFQANPSAIDPETGEILFAHCTIPLNMVERYEFDTHFESGIGVGIRGYMKEGAVTVFKVSGDLSRSFIAEGTLVRNQSKPDLCRTQQVIQLSDKSQVSYFLTNPIGNHHIIVPGCWKSLLEEILK